MALSSRSATSLASRRQQAGVKQTAAAVVSRNVLCRSRILHGDHGHGNHSVPWFKKHTELWQELTTAAELKAVQQSLPEGKLLVVDYYAGWCAVCKTAYPAMCRIADNKSFQEGYVFAKASLDNAEVKDWVKQEGIKGIPHLAVYESSGNKLIGMGASFKKAEAIKFNLRAIAEHRESVTGHQGQLDLDPNFFVIIPGVTSVAAA